MNRFLRHVLRSPASPLCRKKVSFYWENGRGPFELPLESKGGKLMKYSKGGIFRDKKNWKKLHNAEKCWRQPRLQPLGSELSMYVWKLGGLCSQLVSNSVAFSPSWTLSTCTLKPFFIQSVLHKLSTVTAMIRFSSFRMILVFTQLFCDNCLKIIQNLRIFR